MNKNIAALAPQEIWTKFAELCAIPRPSGHEDAIREYLVAQGKAFGIESFADEAGNVIMRKPATPGMEDRKGVILQAHMDMVPQKNNDKDFDFTKDAISAYVDGEWVTADGTTLGADNGMGVAAILAVMGAKNLKHGTLEALITASEETGMDGAFGLKPGVLQGDILLNLDSETEGELYVGCAGGLDLNVTLKYKEESVPAGYVAKKIDVKGLLGGHSGIEIILERGNANKIMARLLLKAQKEVGLRLASIDGGGLRNAIPREAVATVVVPENKVAALTALVEKFAQTVSEELKGVDDNVTILLSDTASPASVMDLDSQKRLLNAIQGCPNGIFRMSPSIKGLVQTSTNLARVVSENGTVRMQALLRSSVESEKEYLAETMSSVFALAGADVTPSGGYSGWNPDMSSPILKTMTESYEALYGQEPAVMAIHAGLECGLLGGKYPGLDMISFGPTICYPHSPDEKVNIASVGKFWNYLLHTLAHAPKK